MVRAENIHQDPLRVLRGIRLLATHPQLRLTAETEGLLAAAALPASATWRAKE